MYRHPPGRLDVDIGVAGANYGWPETEGSGCYTANCNPALYEAPVHEYSHGLGISVTGGFVYRGCDLPDLQGVYFYSDYNYWNSPLWSLDWDGANATTGPVTMNSTGAVISGFGEDEQGELYVADHSGNRILKLVPGP